MTTNNTITFRKEDYIDAPSWFSRFLYALNLLVTYVFSISKSLSDLQGQSSKGNLVIGTNILPITAVNGFLYITSCEGKPTGIPTEYFGRVPLIYDIVNNRLYIYNGGWKSATFV